MMNNFQYNGVVYIRNLFKYLLFPLFSLLLITEASVYCTQLKDEINQF